jgi:hypothetical protein
MPPRQPYLTTTPWALFTPRERKRPQPLRHCPSAKCRRAKACVDAHDQLYCQRSHESVTEYRARLGVKPAKPANAEPWTLEHVAAKREQSDLMLAQAQDIERDMTKRWKAGEFDRLYGKFKPQGIWKHPPERQYTE